MTDQQTPHVLYRFYSAENELLYVGITVNAPARFAQHRAEKPWWLSVARIELEQHPDRDTVLAAERAAIIAERPLHNVVHNTGTKDAPRYVAVTARTAPYQVGDWVALGLEDGRCPVGEIAALDDQWISIRLKSYLDGSIMHLADWIAVRWDEIKRVEIAYREDAAYDEAWGGGNLMDDEHLGEFQTAWERTHLAGTREPVDQALMDYRAEKSEWRSRR